MAEKLVVSAKTGNTERMPLSAEEETEFKESSRAARIEIDRSGKLAEIAQEYEATLERGVQWNGVRWTATDKARDTLLEYLDIATELGEGVTLLDRNGSVHTLDATQLQQLKVAGGEFRRDARLTG